jgi:hypothetical protein
MTLEQPKVPAQTTEGDASTGLAVTAQSSPARTAFARSPPWQNARQRQRPEVARFIAVDPESFVGVVFIVPLFVFVLISLIHVACVQFHYAFQFNYPIINAQFRPKTYQPHSQ